MKSASVLLTLTLVLITLLSGSLYAQQGDSLVIRGPAGSEQTDVRRGEEHYGPVTRTDTLWNIANRVRPHSSVSVHQVMSAIMQANPHAFLDNNPNALESGFLLRIPSLQEMQMINPEAARRHIELGEQLGQSQQQLQANRQETVRTAAEREALLTQTRTDAVQALDGVRAEYAGEFEELREQLAQSIETTESVHRANDELRARLDEIALALDDIRQSMVSESEFQAQIRELTEEQHELRLSQQSAEQLAAERGLANRIMSSPIALILLAFVPALLMIIIASMWLRRKDTSSSASESEKISAHAGANEAALIDEPIAPEDDFELDEALADFDDLDDDDGDDLSALEDEMLVPEESSDDSIRLDEFDDDFELDDFDSADDEFTVEKDPVEKDSAEADKELSQDELDQLFAVGADDESATENEEPSPAELFATDEDSDEESDEPTELRMATTDDDDDFDFEQMMAEFDDEDTLDDELAADDIESLLSRSDQVLNESDVTARATDSAGEEFVGIDTLIEDSGDDSDDMEDEESEQTTSQGDEDDNLAAQLDLARAYLEMDEIDEARETVKSVIDVAQGDILEEANELLNRIDNS